MVSKKTTQMVRPVRSSIADDADAADHPALIALFGDDEAVRHRFAREASTVLLPGGHRLFAEGDPADCLYLVLHGRLEVYREVHGRERLETEIGAGELCGSRALVMGGTRTGSVRAMRDSELLELTRDDFDRLVAQHPHAMMQLARGMASQLAEADREHDVRGQISTVAIVPGHRSPHLPGFVAALATALERHGPTLRLDADALEARLGDGAAELAFGEDGLSDITRWLHVQESHHRFVIYEADQELTPWSRRCIRQADRVLLVAERAADPTPGGLEAYLQDDHGGESVTAGRELILLEPGGQGQERPVEAWLARRHLVGHHFVDPGHPADVERVARFIAGRAVGLVLSGGGARCCAHLGVVRALREAGVPIDVVGGTSGGAIFGAQVALGWTAEEMLARSDEALNQRGSLWDLSLPIHGLIEGRRFKDMLNHLFGGYRIEDLRTPFFCVSTNLSRGDLAVHRSGPLGRWVRASMSVPGLGPPLFDDGEVYVDGSVLNNLPIDVMRDLSHGPILASNVGVREGPRAARGIDSVPTALRQLGRRLLRQEDDVQAPGIIDVLFGAAMISGVRASRSFEPMADLVVHPDVAAFGQLDFAALRALEEIGYRAAATALEGFAGLDALRR